MTNHLDCSAGGCSDAHLQQPADSGTASSRLDVLPLLPQNAERMRVQYGRYEQRVNRLQLHRSLRHQQQLLHRRRHHDCVLRLSTRVNVPGLMRLDGEPADRVMRHVERQAWRQAW